MKGGRGSGLGGQNFSFSAPRRLTIYIPEKEKFLFRIKNFQHPLMNIRMPESSEEVEVEKAPNAPDVNVQEQQMEYPGATKRALIMLSVYLSVFLITLVSAFYFYN
jgi:hypothetical protein